MSRTLTVPAACPRGHELIARTTYVTTAGGHAVGWECLRCLRIMLYRAHYGRRAEIPAEHLDARCFSRQPTRYNGHTSPHFAHVLFESGWGFDDPDPTPELRAERERERYGSCARGHVLTPDNAYVDTTGRRWCRPCRTEYAARRRAVLAVERGAA